MSTNARAASYVLMQFVLLALLILAPRDPSVYGDFRAVLSIIGIVLIASGMAVVLYSFFALGKSLTASPVPKEDGKLVTGGLYSRVRHPIYFGLLLASIGVVLDAGPWPQFAIVLLLYVLLNIKASYEEELLAKRYPEYKAYAKKTPRFFPRIGS
jgi:protein-S-isoprenylcysteine O-methyltransferase Ste14